METNEKLAVRVVMAYVVDGAVCWQGVVEYALSDGYVGIRDEDGHLDEVRAADLHFVGILAT